MPVAFDAYAVFTNICQYFINDADAEIAAKDKLKGYKYPRQANRRQCVGRIVPVFLEAVFTDNERKHDRLWKEVEDYCEKFCEPVRPGRNPKRMTPRDRKFYPNARKPRLS